MKHTPTPWKVVREFFCIGDRDTEVYTIRPESWDVGSIASVNESNGPQKENAYFIIRAVNSHYDLLEAAKTIIENMMEFGPTCRQSYVLNTDLNKLNEAINKAEGK